MTQTTTLQLRPRQAITNAPVCYDYGWMHTLVDNIGVDEKGRPCRLVENDDDWHFEQNVLRYGSGLNLTITDQSLLDHYLRNGWLRWTPEKAVRIHRIKVNMQQAMDWDRQERLEFLTDFLGTMKEEGSDTTYDTGHDMTYYFTARGDAAFEALTSKLQEMGLTWEVWGPQPE